MKLVRNWYETYTKLVRNLYEIDTKLIRSWYEANKFEIRNYYKIFRHSNEIKEAEFYLKAKGQKQIR